MKKNYSLTTFVWLIAYPAVAAAFGENFAWITCADAERAEVEEAAAQADDLLDYAATRLDAWASVAPPDDDAQRREIEHWFGDVPKGDPAHPDLELADWQEKVRHVAGSVRAAWRQLNQSPTEWKCAAEDDLLCGGDVRAYSLTEGVDIPQIALCRKWVSLSSDKDGYANRAGAIVHELLHVAPRLTDLWTEPSDCHAHRDDANVEFNASSVELCVLGLGMRRSGGLGSDGLVAGGATLTSGCDVAAGARSDGNSAIVWGLLIVFICVLVAKFAYRIGHDDGYLLGRRHTHCPCRPSDRDHEGEAP